MKKKKLVIGTRGSLLALWQARWVQAELLKLDPTLDVELNIIKTTGDKILDVPLAKVGGKGLFVKEIEEALIAGRADIAVHSMKDVPTELPCELHLAAICRRENPGDALVSKNGTRFEGLPRGAHLGTSSLRRACQLLRARPDLKVSSLRGNLDTRLRKLDQGDYDAVVLAVAGMKRLGFEGRITEIIPPEIMLPAIGQGAVGIECRRDDPLINRLVGCLNHEETSVAVSAERAFLLRLEGGCQVPIAAYARLVEGGGLRIDGLVGDPSGSEVVRDGIDGSPAEAQGMGIRLAEMLISRGAGRILARVYGRDIPSVEGDVST
ncbi:MAG: hydroxymethylbilane synthase [Nitrospiraceae bacterium]|nr:hydroxymethylbilane synthase [Nitrospiraceae bacterium]